MKKEFYYLSADGETQIHAIEWIPEEEPKAVIQLCHGMAEYIARYDDYYYTSSFSSLMTSVTVSLKWKQIFLSFRISITF